MNDIANPRRYRAIFISDIHLGTRGCKAEYLLDFLRHTESDYLYLVGDIIDCWRLRRAWYWAQSHNDVVQKLLRKARKGTRVVYVPGNHDEPVRDYVDLQFGGIDVLAETIHVGADGKRYLVIHGDAFDGIVKYKWLAHLGDHAYRVMLALDLPGSKLVVGDGPQLAALKRRHPQVHFTGARFGEDLARHFAASDVFVFPSRTDTFGLVLLEALASGLPVAAYPVAGPLDVVGGSDAGVLDEDLAAAARRALAIPAERCRQFALGFSWEASLQQFLANLRPFA